MLAGMLFLVLVLAVGVLIAVDMVKTPDEALHEPGDGSGYQSYPIDRASAGFGAFPPEPAGSGIAVGAHDVGRSWQAEGTGSPGPSVSSVPSSSPVGGHRRSGPPAAQHKASGGELKNRSVGFRLSLLVIIPAAGAAVVTFSIVYMVGSLRGTSAHSQVSSVSEGAVGSALVAGVILVVVLALALASTFVVARSVLRPLRKLRAGALETAGGLPDTVRVISESGANGVPPAVNSVGVDSADEIGDVAQAFDQLHKEVLRLAVSEAVVRGKVNTIFINLSRRSQALVDSQIRLIDDLEQEEQQPERRADLFRLDRLITRMRRYSQNLLILAGHEPPGGPGQPMPLVGVIRAAVSQIEEYERVSMNAQPGIAVSGPAVNDVVHVLTELIENATALSAADTPVLISGRLLSGGGALIEITDRGFGMSADELSEANWRLDHAQASDVTVSKSIGLSVVSRLAARHGIKIRLQAADHGGLTALTWLPNAILLQQQQAASPGPVGVRSRPGAPELGRTSRFSQVNPDRATAE